MKFWLLLLALVATAAHGQAYKFAFGPGRAAGYRRVPPTEAYSPQRGYGFDFGTAPTGPGSLSTRPYYFSVAVPEGNYRVTLTLGSHRAAAESFVKAESRRLLLPATATRRGQQLTYSWTVNVKSRRIDDSTQVALKPRELRKLDWDDRLTLEVDAGPDQPSALAQLEITPEPAAVTVFLAGNSTVVNQDDEPWAAWGQMLPAFFEPGVAVANHAESGLSLASFESSRRLRKVLRVLRPGDYVLIEFGHNDQKEHGPHDGPWLAYTERLHAYVQAVRQRGGRPVLLTSTSRRTFGATGRIENSLGDFPAAVRAVARQDSVPLIDLNTCTTTLYEALGPDGSKQAFVHYPANTFPDQPAPLADNTHFNPYGAYEVARCVVAGLGAQLPALARHLRPGPPPFDPAHPDPLAAWRWPASPRSAVTKPDGN